MTRKRHVTEDEAHLWAHAVKDVHPARGARKKSVMAAPPIESALPSREGVRGKGPKAAGAARSQPPPAKGAATKRNTAAVGRATAPSIDRRTEQKLKRGRIEIDATLDLHGLKQHAAHSRLLHFIARASEEGRKVVLVITGKGTPRGDEIMAAERRGVLRSQVPLWLEEAPLRDYVRGVKTAGPRHGGSGALYVLIKRKKS